MRMFFYFFFHSAWNQIRSFVRTWAFYLLIGLIAVGGFLWYCFLWYFRRLAASNAELPTSVAEILQTTGMSGLNILELVAGFLFLGLLVFQIIGAERSVSGMFKHADVNLLFASDLSPQTVLAFRVANTLELPILAGLFLALRLPFLASKYALSLWGAGSILLAWNIMLAFCVLLKILIYELGSRHPIFRRNVRWVVFALLAGLGYAFYRAYDGSAEKDLFLTMQQFFNAPATRWIPIWGWTKGMMLYALEGNYTLSLVLLGLSLALIALLSLAARRLPADYYEDTLRSAQESSLLHEAVNAEGAALLIMRTRERAVTWTGFHHGFGSSVYFFRVFHDRRRASSFFLSKTMLTYCFAALAGGLYVRLFLDRPISYIPVLVLAVMVFFRTILSPVTEDIRKDTFLLQPEPIWSKLFFSLLGGSCNCALDVCLPLMIGSAVAGFSPLGALAYLPVMMSLDFFASASGVFTDVSIPSSIGTNFKQVIQIILLYAGVIFDGVVLGYGINSNHVTAGFALMTALNVLFGGMFLGLTGVWLYPCKGKPARLAAGEPDRKEILAHYARVGLAMALMFTLIWGAQMTLARVGMDQILAYLLAVYGLGLPAFLLSVGKRPQPRAMERRSLRPGQFFLLIPACFFVMYAGNLLGLLLQGAVRTIIPAWWNPLRMESSGETACPLVQALLVAFAAPVMEEFVFRRCVMERLLPYGERAALLASALLFGLFHSAINQVCYAFLLGLVFGFVYLKTGKLRYSAALHILINTMSSILLPLLLNWAASSVPGAALKEVRLMDVITRPGVLALLLYVTLLLLLALFGAVVFFFGVRERALSRDGARTKTALSAWGIVLFVVVSILLKL